VPPAKKKITVRKGDPAPGNRARGRARATGRPAEKLGSRPAPDRMGPRKRGWRDIEAMSERARLKKLLTDIWHEDIELEEDIFGESDHLAGYYTDSDEEDVPAESDEEVEYEDFEEDED
jgi:hypothetical protein